MFPGTAPCMFILMQDYLVHDTKRNVARAVIVSGVFAAVVTLIGRCEPVVMLWLLVSCMTAAGADRAAMMFEIVTLRRHLKDSAA